MKITEKNLESLVEALSLELGTSIKIKSFDMYTEEGISETRYRLFDPQQGTWVYGQPNESYTLSELISSIGSFLRSRFWNIRYEDIYC